MKKWSAPFCGERSLFGSFSLQLFPQRVQRAVLRTVLQLGEGAEHAALAEVRGGALGAGAKLLAAGLQLLGQLFQPEQFGRALGFCLWPPA